MLRYTTILLIFLIVGGCIYGSSISSLGYRSRTNINDNTFGRRIRNVERTVSGEGYGVKAKGLVNKGDIRPSQKGNQASLVSSSNRGLRSRDSNSNVVYQTFLVTAYTAHDAGMNGRGITASGKRARHMTTVAASRGYSYGTRIYLPSLNRIVVVEDRGGAIRGNRLDLYIGTSKADAMKFGKRRLKGVILK